nr:unnamed protein product [Mus musculus]
MDPPTRPSVSGPRTRARPPPPEALPTVGFEEEVYDCLDYYYLRDFPASGAGRSKGRTRREQQYAPTTRCPAATSARWRRYCSTGSASGASASCNRGRAHAWPEHTPRLSGNLRQEDLELESCLGIIET